MGCEALPALDVSGLTPVPAVPDADTPNAQTAEEFDAERTAIAAAAVPLTWIRPSDHDPDRLATIEVVALEPGDGPEADVPIGAGRIRGLMLHKLMEEALTGELRQDAGRFVDRARELLRGLAVEIAEALPSADEIAATAWRTLQLPEIAELRDRLVPEWPVYAMVGDGAKPSALAGRIDAIAFEGDRADVLVDWKSDVDPTGKDIRFHAGQLRDYLRASGATRGAIVYMTPGIVRWVVPDTT